MAFVVFLDRIEPSFGLPLTSIFTFPVICFSKLFWKQLNSYFVTTLFALLLFKIEFALQVGEILKGPNFDH